MKPIIRIIIIVSFLLFAITGCSKGSSSPIQPDNTGAGNPPALRAPSGRNLLGVYEIHLRSDVPGAEVRLKRTAQTHVNAVAPGSEYVDVEVDFEPPAEYPPPINDYNPYFAFRGGVIWNLQIRLTNNTEDDLYDVRGIVRINAPAIGLHNADGLTTVWDNGVDLNPFKYYGDLGTTEQTASGTQEFQVSFTPPDISENLDCGECTWDDQFKSTGPEGGAGDPDGDFISDNAWVNFAVDASVDYPCLEPYSITATDEFYGTLSDPHPFVTVSADVHPFLMNHVTSVSMKLWDLPGYDYGEEVDLEENGSVWQILLWGIPGQTHEGIYHATVAVTSSLPENPNPQNNPNMMYKDVLLKLGDFDQLIEDLFADPTSLVQGIKDEWEEREDDIYNLGANDGFYISAHSNPDGLDIIHNLKIRYIVWDPELNQYIYEYGGLRVSKGISPVPPVPANGWPLMIFCHFGKFVCLCEAHPPVIFPLYGPPDNYKNKFAVLLPKYRGNSLCFDGVQEDGNANAINSPADWDVDDVLAFLNVVINHEEEIASEIDYQGDLLDQGRVGIMGGSRGGSPAYLAKIRDSLSGGNQINGALITIGSVTDFFLPGIKEACGIYVSNDGYVPEDTYHYYLEDYNVFARVIEPYLQGEFDGDTHEEVLQNARKRLLRSSPVYFAGYLDHLQVHHGSLDELCRVEQTEALAGILGFHSEEPPYTEFLLYYDQYHGIGADQENDWPDSPQHSYSWWTEKWLKAIGGYS